MTDQTAKREKVYIVTWFSGEPYSDVEGIRRVFKTREAAQKYLDSMGTGPFDEDLDNCEYEHYLSNTIQSFSVHEE